MKLNDRQTGTILAALRCYQKHLDESDEEMPSEFTDISTDFGKIKALSADEIDSLCEKIEIASI